MTDQMSAARDSSAYAVKPLQWSDPWMDEKLRGGFYAWAESVVGTYGVWGDGTWSIGTLFVSRTDGDLDDGKAAAQADFEQRIRSALETADAFDAVAGAATFLTWVAESYRAHAKDPENHPEIADAYEGSAQMAEGHAAALRAAFQLGEGTKN